MVYNSHPKIMKKLFYSFVMLVAMSLTFVACEPGDGGDDKKKPGKEPVSNCSIYQSEYTDLGDGTALYVFEVVSNTLDVENSSGSGEDAIIMFCATLQEDGSPAPGTYDFIEFADFSENLGEGLLEGVALSQDKFAGTFGYVIEDGEMTDIVFCADGSVKFEGNATKGILTANITFESGIQGNEGVTYEREYIYNGAFDMSERKSSAPTKNLSRAPKFQK